MTEIKVISSKSTRIDLNNLSSSERTIYFEDLLNDYPDLGNVFIENLSAMVEETVKFKERMEIPTIRELMLIKIMHLGAMPIISSFKAKKSAAETVLIRLSNRTRAVTIDGVDYIIPIGEEINLIGYIVTPKCAPAKTLRGDSLVPINQQLPEIDIMYGHYSLESTSCGIIKIRDDISISPVNGIDDIYMATKFDSSESAAQSVLSGMITREQDNHYLFPMLRAARIDYFARHLVLKQYEHLTKQLPALKSNIDLSALQIGTIIDIADLIIAGVESPHYRAIVFGRDDKRTISAINARHKYISDISAIRANAASYAKEVANQRTTAAIIKELFGDDRAKIIKYNPKLLTKSESKLLEIEIARREKRFNEIVNNKCEHVKLLRALRGAITTAKKKSAWMALKKYFGKDNKCGKCKFEIVCNHEIAFLDASLQDKPYSEIKAKLIPFLAPSSNKCKYCGEILSRNIEATGDALVQDMDENIVTLIYGEISQMLRHVSINAIINVGKLIGEIKTAVYPYIYDIDRLMSRSRTITMEEMRQKSQLYTCIYVAAMLVHIVLSNKQLSFKGFNARNKKTIIIDMLKYIIDIIVLSKNVTIREISGMNKDVIKSAVINAYKSIQSAGLFLATVITPDDPLRNAILHPMYKYLYTAGVINGLIKNKPRDDTEIIECVLPNIKNKSKGADPYAGMISIKWKGTMIMPTKFAWDGFANYPAMKRKIYAETYDILLWRQKLVGEYIYKDTGLSADANGVHGTVFSDKYDKFCARLDEIKSAELILDKFAAILNTHLHASAPTLPTKKYDIRATKLGRIYDENGRRHEWKKFIDNDGNVMKDPFGFADIQCSVCGIMRSKCQDLDDNKIRNALRLNITRDNFFIYYENKCPEGGVHDSRPCKKCGFDGISDEYQAKYIDKYLAEKKPIVNEPVVPPVPSLITFEPFVDNFGAITDIATKLGINQKLIVGLCATENVNYKSVIDGTYIPREASIRFEPRIYSIDTVVRNFLVSYMQLRNYGTLTYPPRDLITVINDSGFPKHKINDLSNLLPLFGDDYIAKFNYMQWTLKPRQMVAFCIQSLCEICLQILADPTEETLKLRKEFITQYFKKIIRQDELVSKPGYFSWTLLYGDREPKSRGYAEVDADIADALANEDEEGLENPFDLGALDLEEEMDEGDNMIHVEGYALS